LPYYYYVVFAVLLILGAPIALMSGCRSRLRNRSLGDLSPILVGQRLIGSIDSFTIMAIPLFMLAG
jgi:C4-dicarboxylate transporter DctM subunit